MARVKTCDVCGKPIDRVALKLFKVSRLNPKVKKEDYSHHADVGECCVMKINQINWVPRRTYKKTEKPVEQNAA